MTSNPSRVPAPWSSPRALLAGATLVLLSAAGGVNDENEKALRRVLTLPGGTTLRGVARQVEDGWEIRSGGRWAAVQAPVQGVALERDLLLELERRRGALEAGDGGRAERAALADWALHQGLTEEGVAEIEALLADLPDPVEARRVLEEHAFRFAVPGIQDGVPADRACAELSTWAAQRSGVSRELAIARMAELEDKEALERTLVAELHSGSLRRRSFAALALGRLFRGEAVEPLLGRAVLDASDDVRKSAAFALGAVGEPGLTVPVVRALETSASPRVRAQAAEALGHMHYAAAVPALVGRLAALQGATRGRVPHSNIFIGRQFAFIQDFDVEVAQFQAVADPKINVMVEGQATDAGVIGVSEVRYEREAITRALQRLTGADPGPRSDDWVRWFEGREAR